MFRLAVLCVFDPMAKMPDREEILSTEFDTEDQACLRALLWLEYRPNDIIMLVEAETGECKHCDQPIEEKPGWVRHRWIHKNDGAYACRATAGKTQAEPK